MELYNHGVNLNVQNPKEDGKTPLHYAAELGRSKFEAYDSVDILIRLGASTKLLTHSWKTPRDLAIAAGHMETAEQLREYEEMSRKDWLLRQKDEEYTALLLQACYRGVMGRKKAYARKLMVSANKIQRCYRCYKARTGVIAFKNKLKKAVEIIGRRYKRRLELNMFKAVMAKCRRLRQAKLLQEAVHAENEKEKRDQAVMLMCTIRIQSFFRGQKARRENPYKTFGKMLKTLDKFVEEGDEKGVKGMILDLSELPHEDTIGRMLNRAGDTYLHRAAQHGHAGVCKILVNVAGISGLRQTVTAVTRPAKERAGPGIRVD